MNNPIEEMRNRLVEEFSRPLQPNKGLSLSPFRRETANDMPRMPQSNIPNQKAKYYRAGRPPKAEPQKFKKSWEGWL